MAKTTTQVPAISAARTALAASVDAARTADDAASEAGKATALLADLEQRVRAGDPSVKFDELERQRQLVAYANLNAQGAAARAADAQAAADRAVTASVSEWITPTKDAVTAYRNAVQAAGIELATGLTRLLATAQATIGTARATFGTFAAQLTNDAAVPVTVGRDGRVIIGAFGSGHFHDIGTVAGLADTSVLQGSMQLAWGLARLVDAAGPLIAGTSNLDDVITAASRASSRVVRVEPGPDRLVVIDGVPVVPAAVLDVPADVWQSLVALLAAPAVTPDQGDEGAR